MDDTSLDALLAEARALEAAPPDALVARVLADARAAMPPRVALAPARAPVLGPAPRPGPRPGPLARLAGLLGGWPALGGLAAFTVLGVILGAAQPAGLSAWAAPLWGEEVSVALGLDDDPLSLLEG